MNNLEQRIEANIRAHEAKLKHVDKLMTRAKEISHPEARDKVAKLLTRRDELAVHLDDMKLKSLDDWQSEEIAKAGPMGIWDVVAQQIEALIERFEHRPPKETH